MLLGFVLACLSVQSVMKGTAAVALVLPLLVLGVPFHRPVAHRLAPLAARCAFLLAGQDHVHHDLVLVHGFSQQKSVLLLYSWCILLSGLAIAMQRSNTLATIVLGVAATVATVYMASCSATIVPVAGACPIRRRPPRATVPATMTASRLGERVDREREADCPAYGGDLELARGERGRVAGLRNGRL